jgi:hypothetical protein
LVSFAVASHLPSGLNATDTGLTGPVLNGDSAISSSESCEPIENSDTALE